MQISLVRAIPPSGVPLTILLLDDRPKTEPILFAHIEGREWVPIPIEEADRDLGRLDSDVETKMV